MKSNKDVLIIDIGICIFVICLVIFLAKADPLGRREEMTNRTYYKCEGKMYNGDKVKVESNRIIIDSGKGETVYCSNYEIIDYSKK